MTARERIAMLLDKGTFNEIDKFVIHQCTDFGMDKNHIIISEERRYDMLRELVYRQKIEVEDEKEFFERFGSGN